MITLSSLVVIPEYALSVCDEGQAVLLEVGRSGERLWQAPHHDLGKVCFAVRDSISDQERCLQGWQYGRKARVLSIIPTCVPTCASDPIAMPIQSRAGGLKNMDDQHVEQKPRRTFADEWYRNRNHPRWGRTSRQPWW